jgi:hypothetical protein
MPSQVVMRESVDLAWQQLGVRHRGTHIPACQMPADGDDGVFGVAEVVNDDLAIGTNGRDDSFPNPCQEREDRGQLGFGNAAATVLHWSQGRLDRFGPRRLGAFHRIRHGPSRLHR